MADAGRILIIPRGDYNANSTYDKLDLVKYKGTSWLAKKNATGVEPSEGEYWQKMFDLTGDGSLEITRSDSGVSTQIIQYNGQTFLRNKLDDNNYQEVSFYGNELFYQVVENGVTNKNTLLHSGNKPSSFYIGNGSADGRIINTSGKGTNVIIVKAGSQSFAIVTGNGYIATDGSKMLFGTDVYCANDGMIKMYTTSGIFNTNGATYYYQYL